MRNLILILYFLTLLSFVYAQKTESDSIKQPAVEYRENIKTKLLEAKAILLSDNGKHWGHQIWNDSILVIDFDNTIYSLIQLNDSQTDDHILYYKKIAPNTLSFVNTTQKYEGNEYATVLSSYLKYNSATIIHELFHLLQFKFRKFKGEPIDYLDETQARILLRLEYQALRNALTAINENKGVEEVKSYMKDAVLFRKERQNQHAEFLSDELEIETLEGLANYTGLVLSTYNNKYEKAISEIDKREKAGTYTRPFPYAMGPAYGLIYDYLDIPWRKGIDSVYNFAEIYERYVIKANLKSSKPLLKKAKARNNYKAIYQQETAREEKQEKLNTYYTDLLINKPTLSVTIADNNYSSSYDMNGTLALKDKGTVYSNIDGVDKSGGKNFGNFSTIDEKEELGKAGILGFSIDDVYHFVFPLPIQINGSQIMGEFYKIDLNPGWKVITHSSGNMEIVRDN